MDDHELPAAEAAYEGPIADGNSTAKRRQTLVWGICIAAVTVMGGFVIYNMMKPTPRGNDPEAAQRLLATADVVRPGELSGQAEASELQVRVAELDRQISMLNQGHTTLTTENAALKSQLESERADAIQTIEALNRAVETRPAVGAPQGGAPRGAVGSVGGAPGVENPGAPLTGPGDPFAPVGGGGQALAVGGENAVRPRRQLNTVRLGGSQSGGPADGPTVARGGAQGGSGGQAGGAQYMSSSMQVFSSDRFVPPNAYVKARVLVGVDAATGVTTSSDPKPVLFRLTGPAVHVGSNGRFQTTDLTGCVVNGAAYGELSSEKVYIRLQRISCPAGDRQFSVATVEGYASHLGKAGVRGNVISREGGLTGRAMIAGTLQGLGRSLSNYTDSVSNTIGIGAGGALTAPPPPDAGTVAAGAVGGGVANAAEMLADYYVKRAEQYQPVIEMPTGIEVELVFLSGFEITPPPSGGRR
jgi:conjugal transfer pilus assembly protein TraB